METSSVLYSRLERIFHYPMGLYHTIIVYTTMKHIPTMGLWKVTNPNPNGAQQLSDKHKEVLAFCIVPWRRLPSYGRKGDDNVD